MYSTSPVKTTIATVLIVLILFNTMGFYGLFLGLGYKAKKEMVHRLDEDRYAPEETITLKLPLSIPYIIDDEDYKRVDGSFEHQGEFYRLVKQKLSNDTLFIVCIKDVKTKNIKQALADYVKTFTDKPHDGKSHSKTQLTFIKDFVPSTFVVSHSSEGWNRSVTVSLASSSLSEDCAPAIPGPPPRPAFHLYFS